MRNAKFLATFASQTGVMSSGQPEFRITEWELTSALASAETLTLDTPEGMSKVSGDTTAGAGKTGWVPIAFAIWSLADPQLPLWQPFTANSLLLTSYDRDLGRVVLTAGSAGVADDAVLTILWTKARLGTA